MLWQVGEEEFVDDACTRDTHWALLFAGGMCCHDHAAGHAIGPHRDLWAIVETTDHLAFRTLLELSGDRCRRACTSGGLSTLYSLPRVTIFYPLDFSFR